MSDFSGFVSSAWAFSNAAAIAPMVSLDRCMAFLTLNEKIKADCARFRPFGPNAIAGGFLGVIGHQGHAFGLGSHGRGRPSAWRGKGQQTRPRNSTRHVDDASRFDPG